MKRTNKNMIVESLVVGPMGVNCYIIADPQTKEACVIDPGADPLAIQERLAKEKLHLKFIINTHGHGDHIGANSLFDVPIYIHEHDKDFLIDPKLNLSAMFLSRITSPKAGRLLHDGDEIELGSLRLKVLHTPGHTPGSITIVVDTIAFTGDTLFCGGIGRSDFPYSNETDLMKSLMKLTAALKDETIIYPGHGPASTMERERRSNPFLNYDL